MVRRRQGEAQEARRVSRLLALGLGKIEVILVDPVQYHAQLNMNKAES